MHAVCVVGVDIGCATIEINQGNSSQKNTGVVWAGASE